MVVIMYSKILWADNTVKLGNKYEIKPVDPKIEKYFWKKRRGMRNVMGEILKDGKKRTGKTHKR
jgi:hypothetical protein